jgi:hypothetical protein
VATAWPERVVKNLVLVTVAPDLFLCLLEQELLDLLLLPLDLKIWTFWSMNGDLNVCYCKNSSLRNMISWWNKTSWSKTSLKSMTF